MCKCTFIIGCVVLNENKYYFSSGIYILLGQINVREMVYLKSNRGVSPGEEVFDFKEMYVRTFVMCL